MNFNNETGNLRKRRASTTFACLLMIPMLFGTIAAEHAAGFTFTLPPTYSTGRAVDYQDSFAYDTFPKLAGFVSAISATNPDAAVNYQLKGGTLSNDGLTSSISQWGTLTLYVQTGAYIWTPDDTILNSFSGGQVGGTQEVTTLPTTFQYQIIATDSLGLTATSDYAQITLQSGVNDNPLVIAGAPSADRIAHAEASFIYSFPTTSVFDRLDTTSGGGVPSDNFQADPNVLKYFVFAGSDAASLTSTLAMNTKTLNDANLGRQTAGTTPMTGQLGWLTWTLNGPTAGNPFDPGSGNPTAPWTIDLSGTPGVGNAGINHLLMVAVDNPDHPASVRRHTAKHFVIYVDSVGEDTPYINSDTAVSVPENQTTVMTVTSLDPDPGATASYSIVGGADQTLFTINAATGVLSFKTPKDFEAPVDTVGNNVYQVTVRVIDNTGLTDEKTIAVSVTNVNEFAPVITSNGGSPTATISVASGSTAVTTVTAIDADANVILTYYVGGKDMSRFNIDKNSGVLTFKTPTDIAAPADAGGNNDYDILVMAFDRDYIAIQSLAVTVVNAVSTLTVSLAGDGQGAVNSNPTGIHCTSGSSCPSTTITKGASVILSPTAATGSSFNSWNPACPDAGSGACNLTMSSDTGITASFDSLRWLRLNTAPATFHGTLQSAYAAAVDGDMIEAKAVGTFSGGVTFNRSVDVMLAGGKDATWNSSGYSTLQGTLKIISGKVAVGGIKVKP